MDTFTPAKLNWTARKGDSFVHTHFIKDHLTHTPINLTGSVFTGVVGSQTLTCEVVDGIAGQFRYSLSPTQTALLKSGVNEWHLICTYSDTTIQTFFLGNVVVE